MRNIIVLFIVIIPILVSCKPEPEATLTLEFSNASSADISVQRRGVGDSVETYFSLNSEQDVFSVSASQTGGSVSSLFRGMIIPADSVIVVFNDSLKIVHIRFVEGSGGSSQYEGRTDIIWRNQPRIVLNLDSYAQEDRGDDRNEYVIARYTFT